MSFLSGILKSVINPATLMQLAMGPAGWASLAMKTIGTAIAQQLIQQLGQQLGLPPALISMAQTAFSAASGTQGLPSTITDAASQLAQQFNLSPMQQGQLESEMNTMLNQMATSLAEGKDFKEAKASGAKSWIMVLAEALGKKLDKKAKEVSALSDQINDKSPSTTTKFGAAAQEFSVLMNAVNSVIKTFGEAVSGMARKQ